MNNNNEKQGRIRKAYAPKGERTQVMMTYRVDVDNRKWMEKNVTNKGRFINELIREYIRAHPGT